MLGDDQVIQVKFECCGRRLPIPLGNIRTISTLGALCPNPKCGARVTYDPRELLNLLNQKPEDGSFKITFRGA
jgi:hypothetical protein